MAPRLERNRPIPLYYQLELQLREQIESGRWAPGTLIPTEKELAERYRVSRITVRMAMARLEDDGLIERRRGHGTTVRPTTSIRPKIERGPGRIFAFEEDILRQGFTPSIQVLGIEQGPPPTRMGQLLGLRDGDTALRIRRLGSTAGDPLWLESRYFPIEIGRALQPYDLSTPEISRLIEEVCDRKISRTRLRIEASAASPRQAHYLEIAPGYPVLLNEFVFFDEGDEPVQALQAFFRADRYAFTFDVGPNVDSRSEPAWTIGQARAGRT